VTVVKVNVTVVIVILVNGQHLYSTFIDLMVTKALYILPHIHPFTH